MDKTKNKLKTVIKRIKLETKYCKLLHFGVLARFSTLRSRTIETKALGTGVLRTLWASQWSLWGNFWNLEVFFWQIISKSTILSPREKYPNTEFFLARIFLHSDQKKHRIWAHFSLCLFSEIKYSWQTIDHKYLSQNWLLGNSFRKLHQTFYKQ